MSFFTNIGKSIYSPEFYANIPQKKLRTVLGYFFLLALFLAFIASIAPALKLFTEGEKEARVFIDNVVKLYPPELEIYIRNGEVSTNSELEPIFINVPENFSEELKGYKLAVIDTKTPFSFEKFQEYRSFAWITKDAIVMEQGEREQVRAFNLSKMPDTDINQKKITKLVEKILPWIGPFKIFLCFGIFIGNYFSFIWRISYLFFFALLVWLVAKIAKKPFSYGASYKIGTHAITLGLIIETLFRIARASGFSYMFTLISLVVVLVNIISLKNTQKKAEIK
ncbi:DUF1189 family protein [Candidatus Peregrinibacteria bacterium]|nr:DUF1189 family protein [Candidatus Peregrinibacteria bacterium]